MSPRRAVMAWQRKELPSGADCKVECLLSSILIIAQVLVSATFGSLQPLFGPESPRLCSINPAICLLGTMRRPILLTTIAFLIAFSIIFLVTIGESFKAFSVRNPERYKKRETFEPRATIEPGDAVEKRDVVEERDSVTFTLEW